MTPLRTAPTKGAAAARNRRSRPDRVFAQFGNLLLALLIIGYPLAGVISHLVGSQTNTISLVFRYFVIVISLLLGIWTASRSQYRFDAVIIIFFACYTFRLFFDLYYSGLPNIEEDFLFFAATVLVPTLALGGAHVWYDQKTLANLIAGIGGVTALLIIYALVFQPDQTLIEGQGGRATLNYLNPISISYHGLYVSVAALIMIATTNGRLKRLLGAAAAIVGVYLLIAGGSRGPLVGLVLAVGLTGLSNARAAKSYIAVVAVALPLLYWIDAPQLVFERFSSVGADASSLERYEAMQLSLRYGIEHWHFGYAYIEPNTGNYPHNLLVEAAMALGVGGLALMLVMQLVLLLRAWRLSRQSEWLLSFLAVSVLANAWISGAIWNAGVFFAILWIANGRVKGVQYSHREGDKRQTLPRPEYGF